MSRQLTRADLAGLPKAQLHLHLEAAMRQQTARELADRYQRLPPKQGPYHGLAGFVRDYESARDLIGNLTDLARVAAELVEDAAAQGILWTEVHCVPFNYGGRLGPPEAVVEAVLDGLRRGASGNAVGAALIVAHNRAASVEQAQLTLNVAKAYARDGVVGLGLVGDEAGFPPDPYTDLFAEAKQFGLLSVPHAGEAAGPDSVRSALRQLGADRIGHGVRAAEDTELLAELARSGVCLDVCITSNVMLQACRSVDEHQLPALIDAGVHVSLGSDGPMFFGVDVVDEYLTAHKVLGLGPRQLAKIALTSLESSRAPEHLASAGRRLIHTWENAW